ncbi:MAG TPA: aminotransferase class V-fold PLP-dependent enzyme [Streptosporangiaceae bacterium]
MSKFVLFGGSGFVGSAVTEALLAAGCDVTVIDRCPPREKLVRAGAQWLMTDVLTDEPPPLPEGLAVILLGSADPRPRWSWTLPVSNAVATARILPALAGRPVLLMSSAQVYGRAAGLLREDTPPELPWTVEQIDAWCDEAAEIARQPCPPWRSAPAGRRLAAAGPSGRWTYALSKLAQERLLARSVDPELLTILRLAEVCGPGREGWAGGLIRKAIAGYPMSVSTGLKCFVRNNDLAGIVRSGVAPGIYNVGGEPVSLVALAEEIRELCGSASAVLPRPPAAGDGGGIIDTSRLIAAGHRVGPLRPHLEEMVAVLRADGRPVLEPAVPVVIPPRAARPDLVAARQQASLWSGEVKHGNRWSEELRDGLARALDVGEEHTVIATASGTAALRLAVAATAGPAAPGDVALLPSFTFPATAEVLLQLGYQLRFADVDEHFWNLNPDFLRTELASRPVRVVVCVDTFGNPCDYQALAPVCREAGVPLVSDAAASLGSLHWGRPLARQADAHAFSMSFAKVLSAGGAGGAVVLPAAAAAAMRDDPAGWCRSELIDELHAIYALDQLAILADLVRRRNRIAAVYRDGLAGIPGLAPQAVRSGDRHSYVHWVMRVPQEAGRDDLLRSLLDCGVQTKPYFRALHLTALGGGERLPVTEELDARVLALPMSSELTEGDAERIVLAVRYCLAESLRGPAVRATTR